MITGVNSSTMMQMSGMMSGMQRPQGADMFQKTDSSGDGSVDTVELSSMATQLYENTGIQIDVEGAIAEYDSDGDGGLNGDEMKSMLDGNGIAPPEGGQRPPGGGGMKGAGPEESSSLSEGFQAYMDQLTAETSETETEDLFTQLLEKLNENNKSEQAYSPFNALV